MTQQRSVHKLIDRPDCCRILSEKRWCELTDPGACARTKGGQVEWAQRANLTVPGQAVVGNQLDDGAVEYLNELLDSLK